MAFLLYDRLAPKGYSVFYDIESLHAGKFDQKIFSEIEACDHFVLVLSVGALDRCVNENDWVRWEIAHALKNKKNIVPVMMRGFTFPENLPEEIAEISSINGVLFESMSLMDARVEQLTTFFSMDAERKIDYKVEEQPRKFNKKVQSYIAAFFHTVGLQSDGTVVAAGSNKSGQCKVSKWRNIVAVSAGSRHTIGLKSDGTVVAVGSNKYGQCDVSKWRNIAAVSAGYSHTVALKQGGTVWRSETISTVNAMLRNGAILQRFPQAIAIPLV